MIKLIALDVDGVLTKGDITINSNGEELKTFNVKDGLGIGLARKAGIQVAIITGRKSNALLIRANELEIEHIYQGIHNKCEALETIIGKLSISHSEVAYMGDDLNDLAVMNEAGFSGAPRNAVVPVKEVVDFISNYNGGEGAVREFIEEILLKKNEIGNLVDLFNSKSSYVQ